MLVLLVLLLLVLLLLGLLVLVLLVLLVGMGLPTKSYITSRILTADSKPQVVRSGQVRIAIVAGAGTLLAFLLLLGLIDGLLMGRLEEGKRVAGSIESRTALPIDPDRLAAMSPTPKPDSTSSVEERQAERVGS